MQRLPAEGATGHATGRGRPPGARAGARPQPSRPAGAPWHGLLASLTLLAVAYTNVSLLGLTFLLAFAVWGSYVLPASARAARRAAAPAEQAAAVVSAKRLWASMSGERAARIAFSNDGMWQGSRLSSTSLTQPPPIPYHFLFSFFFTQACRRWRSCCSAAHRPASCWEHPAWRCPSSACWASRGQTA